MSKSKLFIDNFLVYGLGSVISKAIPLVMVPIVTRLMPDPTFYGLFELSGMVVYFGSTLAILGMYDAMFRYFFERDDADYRKDICSTTFIFTLVMSIIIFILLIIFNQELTAFIFTDKKYSILMYLSAISATLSATNSILAAPTRMQNKRKVFLVTNTLSPVLGYAVSIPLLLNGHYLIALPLAGIVSATMIELAFAYMNRDFFSIHRFKWQYLKPMLKLALPLVPASLIYWVSGSADRVMVAKLVSVEAAGIYSVGAKLGAASHLIYQAFAGGWQYFAFSTMREANQVKSNSLIFEYLGIVSFIGCMFICAICKTFYEIIFVGDYVKGYCVSPYLFVSPLLLMLYQVAGNQFLVIKKSWPCTVLQALGAVTNVVLNFAFLPVMGLEGAGMATMLGYTVTVVVTSVVLIRMNMMVISWRFVMAVAIFIAYFFVWRMWLVDSIFYGLMAACFGSLMLAGLYWREVKQLRRLRSG